MNNMLSLFSDIHLIMKTSWTKKLSTDKIHFNDFNIKHTFKHVPEDFCWSVCESFEFEVSFISREF